MSRKENTNKRISSGRTENEPPATAFSASDSLEDGVFFLRWMNFHILLSQLKILRFRFAVLQERFEKKANGGCTKERRNRATTIFLSELQVRCFLLFCDKFIGTAKDSRHFGIFRKPIFHIDGPLGVAEVHDRFVFRRERLVLLQERRRNCAEGRKPAHVPAVRNPGTTGMTSVSFWAFLCNFEFQDVALEVSSLRKVEGNLQRGVNEMRFKVSSTWVTEKITA